MMPLKHAWGVRRVVLGISGLTLVAGAPAALAAASVTNPWALAGATAGAALVAASGGVTQDYLHRRREERHDAPVPGGRDDCLVLVDGKLPLVREVTDPARLGAHDAAPAETESGVPAPGADGPPAYIPRDLDGDLRERLAAGGFVLLVGDSTAGKSRMAFEAVHATLPDHTLIAPTGLDGLPAAVSAAGDARHCVLWLDDLERFLGPGGLTAAHVGGILSGVDHHRVIVATMRASEQGRLTADVRDDDRTRQGLRDVLEVVDRAWQIRIARMFTTSELERAQARAWDPRIAGAIRHADSYGIAEHLAAGPLRLRDWEDAGTSAAGTHARGGALVTAAIDIRRAGYTSPIPRELLDEIHEHYLDDAEHADLPLESLAEAWTWATAPRSASAGLLRPVRDNRVEVFDYLTDAVQRRAGPLDRVLEPVVRSALASARAADAHSLARTAYNQGRWQLAADAWRIACQLLASDPGAGAAHPGTLTSRNNLALVLRDLGRLEEAEAEYRTILTITERELGPGHPDSLACRGNLAGVLRGLGRLDEAETETRAVLAAWQRILGPDHPSTLASRGNLALVLRGLGRFEEAETETRAVLAAWQRILGPDHPSTLASRNNLARVLHERGRLDEAGAEIRAALAARQLVLGPDHPDTLASRTSLGLVLRDLGWLDEAEAEIRAVVAIRLRVLGPDHPSTLAGRNNLARILRDRGRLAEAEKEIRAVMRARKRVLGPDHPDTVASRNNLRLVLRGLGRADEAPTEMPGAPRQRAPGPGPASGLPGVGDPARSVAGQPDARRRSRPEGTPAQAISGLLGVSRDALRVPLGRQGQPPPLSQPKSSIVDEVEPRIRELLQASPDMPATLIAERIGWDRGLTVLRNRLRELRPAYLQPEPARQIGDDAGRDHPG